MRICWLIFEVILRNARSNDEIHYNNNNKKLPVYATQTCREKRGTPPLILNLETRWR